VLPSGLPRQFGSLRGADAIVAAQVPERRLSFARAARRCMNSSGLITACVVPWRQAVLSLSTTCPALLIFTRSLASAGRVMVRQSRSSRWRSSASQRTAACCAVALLVGAQTLVARSVARQRTLHREHLLRLQLLIGGGIGLDEYRRAVGAPIHAVQHQAMEVNVEREPL